MDRITARYDFTDMVIGNGAGCFVYELGRYRVRFTIVPNERVSDRIRTLGMGF